MKKLLLLLVAMSLTGSMLVVSQNGVVKINNWLVAGPFTSARTTDLLGHPFIDEQAASPVEGEPAGSEKWKKLTASFVDFTKQGFASTQNCAAYAFTYVYVPSDRLAVIRFGSDDGAMIWLNRILVLERPVKRSLVENQDTVFVQLGKGWNCLLIKVDQGSGGWEMICSIASTGVQVSNDRPDPESLAKNPVAAITHIWISKITKDQATISISINKNSSAALTDLRCEISGVSGVIPTQSATSVSGAISPFVIPAKAETSSRCSEVIECNLPLLRLCSLLSKPGAQMRIIAKEGINQVSIEPETATELLMAMASEPGLAGPALQKSAAAVASAIRMYGITTDFSGQARSGLELIAANRLPEVKPILDEIERNIIANIPDLRSDSIFITGHAHMDMNWLWPYNESVKMFHDNFRQAIAFMEQFPDYRMLQSQATIYKHVEQIDPPLFEKVKKYVAEGRFELAGGMWTESDCNLTGGEALCRTLLLGQRYFLNRFGKMARVGWLPDNFGHISQFPQMLKLSGMDYYYFHRCVPFIGPFWWTGPDS